jgi:glucose-6-phosphate isomerase
MKKKFLYPLYVLCVSLLSINTIYTSKFVYHIHPDSTSQKIGDLIIYPGEEFTLRENGREVSATFIQRFHEGSNRYVKNFIQVTRNIKTPSNAPNAYTYKKILGTQQDLRTIEKENESVTWYHSNVTTRNIPELISTLEKIIADFLRGKK